MVNSGIQTTDLPVVTCAGSPAERGEQHGEALRGMITEGLARWAESIGATHGVDPDAYIAGFVHGTEFLPAIQRWTPGLLDEIEGIARGSAQPWQWIYAYNLLDEEWTWARDQKSGIAPGCTVAGFAPEGGTTLLAQTMDIPNIHDGTQAVLRLEPEDSPAALIFTHAGMIGLTGCNEEGLAVVVNNLDMLPASRTGLPVAFVIRGILERRTLADAVDFISEVTHATGQHYGIAAPEGLASVEGWATGVAVGAESGTRLLHTNHPLYTDETVGDVGVALSTEPDSGATGLSRARGRAEPRRPRIAGAALRLHGSRQSRRRAAVDDLRRGRLRVRRAGADVGHAGTAAPARLSPGGVVIDSRTGRSRDPSTDKGIGAKS